MRAPFAKTEVLPVLDHVLELVSLGMAGLSTRSGPLVKKNQTLPPNSSGTQGYSGYAIPLSAPAPAPTVAVQADGGDGIPVIPTCPISEQECSLPFGYSVAAF